MTINTGNEKGFNLIEVLIATVILTIGMLGIASLTVGTIKGNKVGRDVTTATTLAQDKMEDIVQQGYAALPSTDETITEDFGSIPNFPNNKRIVLINVDTPATRMKTVSVQSYWKGGSQPVILNTIISR